MRRLRVYPRAELRLVVRELQSDSDDYSTKKILTGSDLVRRRDKYALPVSVGVGLIRTRG